MKAPENLQKLRRMLGVLNYLANFFPHLADVVYLFQQLTKKDVPWNWSDDQEKAFNHELVATSPTLVL